ncbi:MAG: tRNA uridine-5-carboxymethylaminomethyl(34) synthesis GTPase MnmE [Alsobacter sp.]
MTGDTIFALATPPGRSAVAILRISGPGSRFVLETICGQLPAPREARLRTLRDAEGQDVDRGLVLWFPGPASATGEDCAEFHVHGGRAIVEALLQILVRLPACRPAGPGEFTRRALENGRIDLTQAEAVADLVEAATDAQRIQALRQEGGALRQAVVHWRTLLVEVLAQLGALLDFADESDVGEDRTRQVALVTLADLSASLTAALQSAKRGERLREGFLVVFAGAPNAGKSSLVNAMAGRDIAIVTPHAGTTRDVVTVDIAIAGLPIRLADTAGLRETVDPVEAIGIGRALEQAEAADLTLWLSPDGFVGCGPPGDLVLKVRTQIDSVPERFDDGKADLAVSALTGEGLDLLRNRMVDLLGGTQASPSLVTRLRHRLAIVQALDHVQSARDGLTFGRWPELVAEDVRLAVRALDELVGAVGVETVLDRLFAGFCIGK